MEAITTKIETASFVDLTNLNSSIIPKIIFYMTLLFLTMIIIYIIYIIFNPSTPIRYIRKVFQIRGDDEVSSESTTVEDFTATLEVPNQKTISVTKKIYYLTKPDNIKDTIIIDLPGGAFLNSSNTMKPYLYVPDLDIDVISIEYPVLPTGTALRSIKYIEMAMSYIIKKYNTLWGIENVKVILSTASAGSYYGVKIINKNIFNSNIIKFSAVSGYFGYKTIDNLITAIGDKGYLRRLQPNTILDCSPLKDGIIQTFYAVSDNDILKISSLTFLRFTNQDQEVVIYKGNGHCFYMHFNDPETKKYYKDYLHFIKH